jgi:hypothetical protein
MSTYCQINNFNFENTDMSLHVDDIYKLQTSRETIRLKTFNTILNRCYGQIRYSVNREDSYRIFSIPEFIVGTPLYNMNKCIKFIIIRLTNNGFRVKFYKPNIIYIYWEQKELATSSYLTIDYKPMHSNYNKYSKPQQLSIKSPQPIQKYISQQPPTNYNRESTYNTPNRESTYNTVQPPTNYNRESTYNTPNRESIYNYQKPSIYSNNTNNTTNSNNSNNFNKPTISDKLRTDNDFSFNLKNNNLFGDYIPLKK